MNAALAEAERAILQLGVRQRRQAGALERLGFFCRKCELRGDDPRRVTAMYRRLARRLRAQGGRS